jgi:hypothetical protein
MKISNMNPGVLIISSILTVIGTGALIGFFFRKSKNGERMHESRKLEKELLKKLKHQGKHLKSKVKDRIDSSRTALEDLSN